MRPQTKIQLIIVLFSIPLSIVILLFWFGEISFNEGYSQLKMDYTILEDKYEETKKKYKNTVSGYSVSEMIRLSQESEIRQCDGMHKALAWIKTTPYDKEENNCYDRSQALQKRLKELNIESSILINEKRNHAWVAVWIEPDTGTFVEIDRNFRGAEEFYKPFELRDHNNKVICD